MDTARVIGRSWPTIRKEALRFAAEKPADAVDQLVACFARPEWELRFFAVCALGPVAAVDERALDALRAIGASELDWQINEGLAFAFDDYCAGVGYELALPEICRWLASPSLNQRRAVTEGLRRWTDARRPYFHQHPEEAISLLSNLRSDPSPYVRRSVGNAMRDIWREHPALVLEAVRTWVAEDPDASGRRAIAKLALRSAAAQDPLLSGLWTRAPVVRRKTGATSH